MTGKLDVSPLATGTVRGQKNLTEPPLHTKQTLMSNFNCKLGYRNLCYTSRFLCKGLRSADKERGALHVHQTEMAQEQTCRKDAIFYTATSLKCIQKSLS